MDLNYSIQPRWRPRLNARLIIFILLICAPFAWFFIAFAQDTLSGGIESHGSYLSVNLKALGNFFFDGQNGILTDVPKRYRELDGKRVELQGFMYAANAAGQTARRAQLVWNIQKCCFGGPPLVQERVFLQPPAGRTMPLYDISTLVRVVGTLHVRVDKEDGGAVSTVYEMVPDSIKPVS